MGILDDIAGIFQKPQSIATGAVEGFYNQAFRGGKDSRFNSEQRNVNRMLDELEAAGVDTSEWSGLRAADVDTSNIFSGIVSGAKGNLRPSDAAYRMGDQDPTVPRGALAEAGSIGTDLALDPLLALGPAAKAGKLGKLAEGAATVGKAADLTKGQKAAQFGRQMYQGLMATGDPLTGLGAGMFLRQGENAATRFGPQIGGAIARRFNKSTAAAQAAGAAEPLALNAGPARKVTEAANVIPGFDEPIPADPVRRLALGQGTPSSYGDAIEAGPVGSTGGLNPQIMETLAGLGQPRQLPPAFGTSGGFPMPASTPRDPADELLEVLMKALPQLRGR